MTGSSTIRGHELKARPPGTFQEACSRRGRGVAEGRGVTEEAGRRGEGPRCSGILSGSTAPLDEAGDASQGSGLQTPCSLS